MTFPLYVSSVEGHLVSRFGSKFGQTIGAKRSIEKPTEIEWFTDEIVPIPQTEYQSFRREYESAIRAGSLRRRTEAEYLATQMKNDSEEKEQ